MMQAESPNPYAVSSMDQAAVFAEDSERLEFIRRTYAHLTGAIMALIGLEVVLFTIVPDAIIQRLVQPMTTGYGPLVVLVAFMAVSWVAHSWAHGTQSRGMQYAGLGLYVIVWAVFLLPLMYFCISVLNEPQLPVKAAAITAITFLGLTVFVFTTRVDLAPWGKYLALAGLVAIAVIFAGMFFGFSLGLWGSALLIALMCGYILYDTSNVLHHYHTSQYVAASLALFASVVTLFFYILRIMMMFAGGED